MKFSPLFVGLTLAVSEWIRNRKRHTHKPINTNLKTNNGKRNETTKHLDYEVKKGYHHIVATSINKN